MKKITEKQAKFLRNLLRQVEHARSVDVDSLSQKEAHNLISQLIEERNTQRSARPKQTHLPFPAPEPLPPDDPSIPPELAEFKRWACKVFQRGELTMKQLCELQDARFGKLIVSQ